MRCLKTGKFFVLAFLVLVSCTKKQETNDLSTSPPPAENKLVENTEEKECMGRYTLAKDALLALQTSATPANFRKFRDAFPPPEEKIVYCENLRFVLSAFDARLDLVRKTAPNKKEYAAFLVKAFPYTDGAMAETVCDEMSKISKADAEAALRGVQENNLASPPECFFRAGEEMVDATDAELKADRAARLKALDKVKAKELLPLKKLAISFAKAAPAAAHADSKEE
jgi:hypothetical protein